MLANLHVKNFALIEEAEVDFTEGLNILTGETGAGKSIIIGSILIALGGKAPVDIIGSRADYAFVELTFEVEDEEIRERLNGLGFYTEDNQLILSRKIMKNRTLNRVNGENVTIGALKSIAGLLIDIHGQHEHQSLLNKDKHLEIVDAYADEGLLKKKKLMEQYYRDYRFITRELSEQDIPEEEKKRTIDFLKYEISEIENAGLKEGEDEELEERLRKMSHSEKITRELSEAGRLLSDRESAGELLGQAQRNMHSLLGLDDNLDMLYGQLENIDNLLSDFIRDMEDYLKNIEFNEYEYNETVKRSDDINRLKSKYGNSIQEIFEYRNEAQEKLEKLLNQEKHRNELTENKDRLYASMEKLAKEITKLREKSARELEKEIVAALFDLNFLDVRFEVRLNRQKEIGTHGWDEAEFLISMNPGEDLKPLNKIASGGEMSRIMLALKSVLASKDSIGSLVFDEIDTGVSGRTAQKVSEKLACISAKRQVICITHLPQIASMAESHFLITKEAREDAAITEIRKLGEKESIEELARILGGARLTEAVYENAREMKKMAEEIYSKKKTK